MLTATAGVLVKVEAVGAPKSTTLTWAYAGADGRKGAEAETSDASRCRSRAFSRCGPEDCTSNLFTMQAITPVGGSTRPASRLHSPAGDMLLAFPAGSVLGLADFPTWIAATPVTKPVMPAVAPHLPVLTGAGRDAGCAAALCSLAGRCSR